MFEFFSTPANRWLLGALIAVIVGLSSLLFVEVVYPGDVLERAYQASPIPQYVPFTAPPQENAEGLEMELQQEQQQFEMDSQALDQELQNMEQELQGY